MNNIKFIFNRFNLCLLALVAFTVVSCETLELDGANNPNELTPEQVNPDFLLNSIQVDFGKVVERFGAIAAQVTRIDNMLGRDYQNTFSPADFNDVWSGSYQSTGAVFSDQNGHDQTFNGILADVRAMTPIAEENELFHHLGIAQVIEAYTIVSLVDFFGNIPYSEALTGSTNLNPNTDSGDLVYEAALNLLDEAIANFDKSVVNEPQLDLYYGGSWSNWIKAANTIKMKIYLQKRLVDANAIDSFNAIVATGDYIQTAAEDFQFQWGNNVIQPDSRHPRYANNYESDGADEYMSNWLMNLMSDSSDPRIRYYYYRQANAVPGAEIAPNEETLSCSLEAAPQHYIDNGFDFCFLSNGYWGRDHGDDAGTPPDGFLRTNFGVYPAGGKFDDSSFSGVAQGDGAQGVGITPIMLSSWVDFMLAEIALSDGNNGTAQTLLISGINKSISKTVSFGSLDASANPGFEPTTNEINTFADNINMIFENATTDEQRWNTLAEQYWVSLFGNGLDAYNFYRRTGYPSTLQPNREPEPGRFIRSFFYPADLVSNNSSVDQKSDTNQKVFWDNNPDSDFPFSN